MVGFRPPEAHVRARDGRRISATLWIVAVTKSAAKFVVATPSRSVCDHNARVLHSVGALRFLALGTRRGTAGVPKERTRLNPWIGLAAYVAARSLSQFRAETFRFGLLPWLDSWVRRQLQPGDHIISSYGYVNDSFAWVRKHGGKTFLDGGNSHPENYWNVLAEEYARWDCPLDPMPRNWFERSKATMPLGDYILSPSSYVTKSFRARGFRPDQILQNIYPLDLICFSPRTTPRHKAQPLTIISTGAPSLRKGTPYLLEAFRIIRKTYPDARLLLNDAVHDSLRPILGRWNDLTIEWTPSLPHRELAKHLRSADIFVLPSLEDGFAQTVGEALACGLPVITTPNTGASDLIRNGENGEVIPIKDVQAIVDACLKWSAISMESGSTITPFQQLNCLSFEYFSTMFLKQIREIGLSVPMA
jgi:glycosyltransferase involved in cell wall biosynthesis